jgi:hypothetical protein
MGFLAIEKSTHSTRNQKMLDLHVLFATADKRSQLGNRQVVNLLYPLVEVDSRG